MSDANVRRAQIVFLVVLAMAIGQVSWWLIAQSRYAESVHQRWQGLYEADVVAVIALLDRGVRRDSIQRLFPHLELDGDTVRVSADALEQLTAERREHIDQYSWEGIFFLAVLCAGIGVILRAVRRDAQLRRWQNNFLAAVSHELKSPLASLQLAAETLQLRDGDAERRARLYSRMLADVDRLASMVAKVIDTQRLDRRHVQLEPRLLSLADAIGESLAEQSLRTQAAGIDVQVDVPAGLTIEADPVGVRTVLRNVLENALKATRDDGGRVRLEAAATADGVRLDIADDGVGFPVDEAANLFEKFYRVGDEMRRTRPGTGLGLYLSRRFVELEGGSISARSEGPGLGARFSITWPPPSASQASVLGR
ncbi:MAG: HAMP domain-containing sensor histidine kinase [Acidobacteriota bacterium]